MVNFRTATFEELDQHAMEELVFDGGAISPILRGHLFVEGILHELLHRILPNPDAILQRNNFSFDMKIDLARALDVISAQHVSMFRGINRIRNKYAHQPGYQVSIEELNSLKFDWAEIQNKAFNTACTEGADEAARLAVIFMCWEALSLIKKP